MKTYNPTETLTIKIDIESLLKTIYAESAWHYMTKVGEGSPAMLIDDDRRAIVLPMLSEAFGHLCAMLQGHLVSHNQVTCLKEGMLHIEIARYKPITSTGEANYSALVSKLLSLNILVRCYPNHASYAQSLLSTRRALLTLLAFDEQIH